MRSLLVIAAMSVVLGTSAGATLGANGQRVYDLLVGIFQDVGAIATSFAGGPDDPTGPVSNSATLNQDRAYLAAATDKATQLASELQRLEKQSTSGGQ